MNTNQLDPCYACGRKLDRNFRIAWTSDGSRVYVGPDCYRKILASGNQGYQPSGGGPRLFGEF